MEHAHDRPATEELLRFLVGPTAVGKSVLALVLAERLGAEILSLDSMLVYRGMDVGTAKPGAAERARVRHHLLDLVLPSESFSVQRYVAAARAALADVRARGVRALFVGGTGLYLKVLTHGLFGGPETDVALRSELEARWNAEGADALHLELARADPVSAGRIHARDKKRVVRALEVWVQTGRALSDWQQEWKSGAGEPRRIVGLSCAPRELDVRIAERVRLMLDSGWVEEARAIRDGVGFGPTAAAALGYAEVLAFADGTIDRAECERRIALSTRQFARRQRTWFRKFPEIAWVPWKREDPAGTADRVLEGLVG